MSSSKSKTALFSNEGKIIFRRIVHPGQKLELRLWRSGVFELDTSRRDCGLVPISVWLISSVWYRSKTNMNTKRSKSNGIKPDQHRNRPQEKRGRTARLYKKMFWKHLFFWRFRRLQFDFRNLAFCAHLQNNTQYYLIVWIQAFLLKSERN